LIISRVAKLQALASGTTVDTGRVPYVPVLSVRPSVCRLLMNMFTAKTADSIEMPFEMVAGRWAQGTRGSGYLS